MLEIDIAQGNVGLLLLHLLVCKEGLPFDPPPPTDRGNWYSESSHSQSQLQSAPRIPGDNGSHSLIVGVA